jgi:hypothetical protein
MWCSVDKVLEHISSMNNYNEQRRFVKKLPLSGPIDERLQQDVCHVLKSDDTSIRKKLWAIYIAEAYKDASVISQVITDCKCPAMVRSIASHNSGLILSDFQLLDILFLESMPLFLVPKLIYGITKYKRHLITRDLVDRVAAKYPISQVYILLSYMKDSQTVFEIIVSQPKLRDYVVRKPDKLIARHPGVIYDLILDQMEQLRKLYPLEDSYTAQIGPYEHFFEDFYLNEMFSKLASYNNDMCNKLLIKVDEWFVIPAKKYECDARIPRMSIRTRSKNQNLMLKLYLESDFVRDLSALHQFWYGHKAVENMITIFDAFVKKYMRSSTTYTKHSRKFIQGFILAYPRHSVKNINQFDLFIQKIYAKYGSMFIEWLTNNFDTFGINEAYLFIPAVGSLVADKLYRKTLTANPTMFEMFSEKSCYMKFDVNWLTEETKLKQFMDSCSNNDPDTRAQIISDLLFSSLYHGIKVQEILEFIKRKLKNERDVVVEEVLTKAANPILLRNLRVTDRSVAETFQELLVISEKRLTSNVKEHVFSLLFNVMLYQVPKTGDEKQHMVKYVYQLVNKLNMFSGYKWIFQRFYEANPFVLNQILELFIPVLKQKIAEGHYDELSFALHKFKCPEKYPPVIELYHHYLQSLLENQDTDRLPETLIGHSHMDLLSFMNKIVKGAEKLTWATKLIAADASFILVPSIQRIILSRYADYNLINKYLDKNEKSTLSYSDLLKCCTHDHLRFAKSNEKVITFNPFILKETKIYLYRPKEQVKRISRMIFFSTAHIIRGNFEDNDMNFYSCVSNNMLSGTTPVDILSKRMIHLLGSLAIDKDEQEELQELIDKYLLSKENTEEYPRNVTSPVHYILAELSKTLVEDHPEQYLDELFSNINAENCLYYYGALNRCSSYISRQESVKRWLAFINRVLSKSELVGKVSQSENNGDDENEEVENDNQNNETKRNPVHSITVQKIALSWFKMQWKNYLNDENLDNYIEKCIKYYGDSHKDTRLTIVQVLLDFITMEWKNESPLINKILSSLEKAIVDPYIEIPSKLALVNPKNFKDPKILIRLANLLLELLDYKELKVLNNLWLTFSELLMNRAVAAEPESKLLYKHILENGGKSLIQIDVKIKNQLISTILKSLVRSAIFNSSIFGTIIDSIKYLLTDEKLKKLDMEQYNASNEWDRPAFSRIMIIVEETIRIAQDFAKKNDNSNLNKLKLLYVDPVIELLIQHQPTYYFSSGFGLKFSIVDWKDTKSIVQAFSELAEELLLSDQTHIYTSICSSNMNDVLFGSMVHRYVEKDAIDLLQAIRDLIDFVESDTRKEQILQVFASVLLLHVREEMRWNEQCRELLRELRSKRDNILVQIYTLHLVTGSE